MSLELGREVARFRARRSHQYHVMNNEVLDENFGLRTVAPMRCAEELGGIIKPYHRETG